MAPRAKRAAEANDDGDRATKVARTGKNGDSTKSDTKKGAAKSTLSTSEFTTRARPLHVSVTHTPPSILSDADNDKGNSSDKEDEEISPEDVAGNVTASDIGFIGNLTLVPTSFSTGSYGWKGSKRITVELQGGDSDKEGHKEKVQVMLSINATVVGSKPSKANKAKKGKKAVEEEEAEDEDQDEVAPEEVQ